jgi:hypothetical protein
MLLAIDPGDVMTGYCALDENYKPVCKGKISNDEMLRLFTAMAVNSEVDHMVIEMIKSYGMAVGDNVFETCVMVGKLEHAADMLGITHSRLTRMDVKMAVCHNSRAKDANVTQALIDRFAQHDTARGKGTKKNPDWFYGFARDMWAAYAVGVTYMDMERGLA